MKKIIARFLSVTLSFIIACSLCPGLRSSAVIFTPGFELHSASAIAIGLDTNTVLYQKSADTVHPSGSLVQIMAAALILESGSDLNTRITADASLYEDLYSDDLRYANILNGDVLTVEELLYAMLLTSSCEAASILADHFGNGDQGAFVEKMNQKAQVLGCKDTHFVNVTGLHDDAQVTTARDMAVITQYALSVGRFENIATAPSFAPKTPNQERHDADWVWYHSNSLTQVNDSYYMEGVEGIKTANDMGRNLVSIGTMDGNKYLIVLLAAPVEDLDGELQYYNLDDAQSLFSWLFNHFSYETILSENTELGQIEVANGDGVDYVLVKPAKACLELWCDNADLASVSQKVELYDNVTAPVKTGDKLGTVELTFSGETIGIYDLVATSSVELSKGKYWLALAAHFPKTPWLGRAVWMSVILVVGYAVLCFLSRRKRKKKLHPAQPVHLRPNPAAVKKEADKTDRKTVRKPENKQ